MVLFKAVYSYVKGCALCVAWFVKFDESLSAVILMKAFIFPPDIILRQFLKMWLKCWHIET